MDQKDPETRYLICRGLTQINNKGLKTLIESQAFSLKDTSHLNPIKIAFYITPLINALIRVGSMSEKEVLFLCFIDPDKKIPSTKRGAAVNDVETAAEQTARVAKNARARQNTAKDKAIGKIDFKIQKNELLDNKILIVELDDSDDLPRTMTGVVAAHFMNKYNRPCLLGRRNQDGELRGSLRGSANFKEIPDAKTFLEASKIVKCMGHNNACGFSLKISNLPTLLTYINSSLPETLSNCYLVDYVFDSSEYLADIAIQLGGAEDLWGNGVDEVKVIIEDIPLEPEKLFIMGADKSSSKFEYNNISYIRFKDEQFIQNIQDSGLHPTITIYGKFNLNEYAGRIISQIFIEDYEIHQETNKWDF